MQNDMKILYIKVVFVKAKKIKTIHQKETG